VEQCVGAAVFFCRRFSSFVIAAIFVGFVIFACCYLPAAAAQTPTFTYTYTGKVMTPEQGNGCSGCIITGSFTTSQPLSANLGSGVSGVFMQPVAAPYLVSYSFAAGPNAINDSNNSTFAPVRVVTDSTGAIVGWNITLSSSGQFIQTISSPDFDHGTILFTVSGDETAFIQQCSNCSWYSGNGNKPGTWSGNTPGDIRAIAVPFNETQSNGPVTIEWKPSFLDTNYTAVCTLETKPSDFSLPVITKRSTDSMTVNPMNGGEQSGILDCIAIPDTDVSNVIHARQTFSGFPPTLTAPWSAAPTNPYNETSNQAYQSGYVTPACAVETEGSTSGSFTGVIGSLTPESISMVNAGFASGTLHCIEIPDFDQAIVRGSRALIVSGNSTTPIQWNTPFPDSNYVASCSVELPGATGGEPPLAISTNSKTPGSILVNQGAPSGTVNCVALRPTAPPSPPPPASCPAISSVFPFAGGNKSADGYPTAMLATFSPSTSNTPMTLTDAENACGVAEFDWQQFVTSWPLLLDSSQCNLESLEPLCLATVADPNTILFTPPKFYDPPKSGYTYNPADTGQNYPYYYPYSLVPVGCAIGPSIYSLGTSCLLQVTTNNNGTLNFADYPVWSLLPSGQTMSFETHLVGVLSDGTVGPSFFQWTWQSTYNGTIGGSKAVQTASSMPVDATGNGGVTITSINGVTQTPPVTTCSAAPSTLWPPNGQSVPVTISGTVKPGTNPLTSSEYAVVDAYGQIQPRGSLTLDTAGNYSFQISLIAARRGYDVNVRSYTVSVRGRDSIGNVGSCSTVVTVPHDQGN